MDAHVEAVEDFMLPSLNFKSKGTAKYVTDRRSVTFHATGGNTFTPTGTRQIKFMVTGDQWLVPSTVRVVMTLNNTSSTSGVKVRPLAGPHSFFRRLRVLAGGAVIEDIDEYARTHEMFHALTSRHNRDNDDIQAFGFRYDDETNYGTTLTTANTVEIDQGSQRVVMFRPFAGILRQEKWLPPRYMQNLQFELELVSSGSDAMINVAGNSDFTAADTSSSDWSLTNVMLKADVCVLDNALDNQIADHLLGGKSLPLNYQTPITQTQSVSGWNVAVNISRAVSRLAAVFVTMDNSTVHTDQQLAFNTFFHPMSKLSTTTFDPTGEVEIEVMVGNKRFPEYPVQSLAEAHSQLEKCVKELYYDDYKSMSIRAAEYRTNKFIIGFNTSKVFNALGTGVSTRQGDLLRIALKPSDSTLSSTANSYPETLHVCLISDQMLELRDSGVVVFD